MTGPSIGIFFYTSYNSTGRQTDELHTMAQHDHILRRRRVEIERCVRKPSYWAQFPYDFAIIWNRYPEINVKQPLNFCFNYSPHLRKRRCDVLSMTKLYGNAYVVFRRERRRGHTYTVHTTFTELFRFNYNILKSPPPL